MAQNHILTQKTILGIHFIKNMLVIINYNVIEIRFIFKCISLQKIDIIILTSIIQLWQKK